tara:strand:+ start:2057 stop:3259 length:1203 start_codon:yes stop_codon:yes gene_type:complete
MKNRIDSLLKAQLNPPGWMLSLTQDINDWLKNLETGDGVGCYRFSTNHSTFNGNLNNGLGITCLVFKTLYILGLTDKGDASKNEEWIKRIKSFQNATGRTSGFFEDPGLLSILDARESRFLNSVRINKYMRNTFILKNVYSALIYLDTMFPLFERNIQIRRAETRQACATLMMLNTYPEISVKNIPNNSSEVKNFINDLDWETPYNAGSHAGHLLAFLHINSKTFGINQQSKLKETITNELDKLRNPITGAWHKGNESERQIINGAMKVLSGYSFCNLPLPNLERLIDYCLKASNDEQACDNVDITFVLHQATKVTEYRKNDIKNFALSRIQLVEKFRIGRTGFAFSLTKPKRSYYGVNMTTGEKLEADIHGTFLHTWTLVMISDILGWKDKLGWELPIT